MATPRTLSPAARARLRRGYLMGGAVLGLIWLGITIAIGVQAGAAAAGGSQLLLVIFSAPAATLLALGLLAERSARAFDAEDGRLSDALEAARDLLLGLPRSAAYQSDEGQPELHTTGLLDVGRPAAAATVAAIARALEKHLEGFPAALASAYGPLPPARPDRPLLGAAGAVRGLRHRPYPLSGGTSERLAGATEAVAEPERPTGSAAPRWVTLPGPAVESWLRDLLEQVAHVLGGGTHASATVMASRADLVAHFGGQADRPGLADHLATVPDGTPIRVRGPMLGPETWLATSVQVGGGEPELIWPSGFPALLGQALGEAAHKALAG